MHLTLPGVMEEQKQRTGGEGHFRYRITLKDSGQAAKTQVDIFMRIDKSDSLARNNANETALNCLGLIMLEMPDPKENVRELSHPRALQIDGRTAMSFSMTHAGKYATDSWNNELVTRTTYCVIDADRKILIQAITPVDAPQELFAASLKGIENLKFAGK
ncbi:hypothetical protein [Undibacterium sp. TS12]|uniref:hypothetical protein n=1 Tax=Undibacterium sp. TS12 TaxID=2908202 RepID=UPI001F4C9C46|nr:hypothetical protein [Undibacterium sp. TS12]MCH8621097.1 hypothetical protein [Undibacterium sp. TS12]